MAYNALQHEQGIVLFKEGMKPLHIVKQVDTV